MNTNRQKTSNKSKKDQSQTTMNSHKTTTENYKTVTKSFSKTLKILKMIIQTQMKEFSISKVTKRSKRLPKDLMDRINYHKETKC